MDENKVNSNLVNIRMADSDSTEPPLNRQQRRELERRNKKMLESMKKQNDRIKKELTKTPATISEVVQIATAVANDLINDYHTKASSLLVTMSLSIDILRKKLVDKGLLTDEEFNELLQESVKEFNEERLRRLNTSQNAQSSDGQSGVPFTTQVENTDQSFSDSGSADDSNNTSSDSGSSDSSSTSE